MRRAFLLLVVLVAVSAPLSAQQPTDHPLRLSLLTSDLGYTESDLSGSNWTGGFTLGLAYQWNPRWSAEVSYTRESHRSGAWTLTPAGTREFRALRVISQPLEATGQFNIVNSSRWTPFVGLGARYTAAPDNDPQAFSSDVSPIVVAGTHLALTRSLSLRFEAKYKIGDSTYYDQGLKTGFGVGWRF